MFQVNGLIKLSIKFKFCISYMRGFGVLGCHRDAGCQYLLRPFGGKRSWQGLCERAGWWAGRTSGSPRPCRRARWARVRLRSKRPFGSGRAEFSPNPAESCPDQRTGACQWPVLAGPSASLAAAGWGGERQPAPARCQRRSPPCFYVTSAVLN